VKVQQTSGMRQSRENKTNKQKPRFQISIIDAFQTVEERRKGFDIEKKKELVLRGHSYNMTLFSTFQSPMFALYFLSSSKL